MTEQKTTGLDDDAADLLYAMYHDESDEDDAGETPVPALRPPPPSNGRTRRIKVGPIGYDVPTPETIDAMDRRLIEAERLVAEQARAIRRLEAALSAHRTTISRHAAGIDRLGTALDRKIDRRDG